MSRMPAHLAGSGGNGSGRRRTISSRVRSVSSAVEQVQPDAGAEPARADAEAGEPDDVDRAAAERAAPQRREAAARVDRAAPAVREADPLELREGREEVLGQPVERRRALVALGRHAAGEVVDRVVAAPEDPAVVGLAVVVEQVRDVGESLPAVPADRRALLRRQRLGHQHVVVDGHDVAPDRAHERRERAGREQRAAREHATPGRLGAHARAVAASAVTGVPSQIRAPAASAARARPQHSRAGSTSAETSRVHSPPRYVGEFTCARTAGPSSSSASQP